jgi:hypothetical protein
MSQSYKGHTIPAYADAADGPLAFSDFVDSGPIPRFADATARNTAIATPTEGQLCYNLALDQLEIYNGTGWISFGINVGTGVLDLGGARIADVGDPTTADDVASWDYVQANMVQKVYFSEEGVLSSKTGTFRWYAPADLTIQRVVCWLGTTSASGAVVLDVNKNASGSILSSAISIAASSYLATAVPSVTSMTKDTDFLLFDIDSPGSGAADLAWVIEYVLA